jgi:hypothetical protein
MCERTRSLKGNASDGEQFVLSIDTEDSLSGDGEHGNDDGEDIAILTNKLTKKTSKADDDLLSVLTHLYLVRVLHRC